MNLAYACSAGGPLHGDAGRLQTTGPRSTIEFAATGARTLQPVTVTTIWLG